jgi:hypothetical protein
MSIFDCMHSGLKRLVAAQIFYKSLIMENRVEKRQIGMSFLSNVHDLHFASGI